MNFNLKSPCGNCPFRADKPRQRGWLGYNRAQEIADTVLTKTFRCHKTIGQGDGGSMCAGALSVLKQSDKQVSPFGNAMVQIAERLGLYNPVDTDTRIPVFRTAEEMARFHSHQE